jgi:hypothetical protein
MRTGKADVANHKIAGLLQEVPNAGHAEREGDHHSTPYQRTFQHALVDFFNKQWGLDGALKATQS